MDNELKSGITGYRRAFSIKLLNKFLMWINNFDGDSSKDTLDLSSKFTINQFAPIYDSGCCLGRERVDDWVKKAINDPKMLEAYVNKGESEIHWKGSLKKRKHLELVALLLETYPKETKNYILRVQEKYQPELIKQLISNIDKNVPENLINFKLSEMRKQLMFKLVTLRIEKLIQLL